MSPAVVSERPALELFDYCSQKRIGLEGIQRAVIDGKRDVAPGADFDTVLALRLNHHGAFLELTDSPRRAAHRLSCWQSISYSSRDCSALSGTIVVQPAK